MGSPPGQCFIQRWDILTRNLIWKPSHKYPQVTVSQTPVWCLRFGTLWWRHNDHDSVSNHQRRECLLKRLFRRRSKKTSKLRVTGLCVGNSPGPVNSPHKGPVTRKMFPFDDVIMDGARLKPTRIPPNLPQTFSCALKEEMKTSVGILEKVALWSSSLYICYYYLLWLLILLMIQKYNYSPCPLVLENDR